MFLELDEASDGDIIVSNLVGVDVNGWNQATGRFLLIVVVLVLTVDVRAGRGGGGVGGRHLFSVGVRDGSFSF